MVDDDTGRLRCRAAILKRFLVFQCNFSVFSDFSACIGCLCIFSAFNEIHTEITVFYFSVHFQCFQCEKATCVVALKTEYLLYT